MKRDWYVYGEDRFGRRRNLAGGGFTEQGAIKWAQAAAKGDARTMEIVKVIALRSGSECYAEIEFDVTSHRWHRMEYADQLTLTLSVGWPNRTA